METGSVVAFAVEPSESAALEVRINFGVFAGRAATAAELDDLAHRLVPEVGEVSIVAEERREVGPDTEVALHQVRIELDEDHTPKELAVREALSARLVGEAIRWVDACVADRHVEVG